MTDEWVSTLSLVSGVTAITTLTWAICLSIGGYEKQKSKSSLGDSGRKVPVDHSKPHERYVYEGHIHVVPHLGDTVIFDKDSLSDKLAPNFPYTIKNVIYNGGRQFVMFKEDIGNDSGWRLTGIVKFSISCPQPEITKEDREKAATLPDDKALGDFVKDMK